MRNRAARRPVIALLTALAAAGLVTGAVAPARALAAAAPKPVLTARTVDRLAPAWFAAGVQGGLFAPAASGGRIYASCAADVTCAYTATTGRLQWRQESAGTATPLVAGGLLIGSCANAAQLCAVSAATGRPVWTARLADDGQVASSPSVADGVVYVGGQTGALYALSEKTGKGLWDYWSDPAGSGTVDPVDSRPVIDDGVAYISSPDHTLQAVSTKTHRLLWSGAGNASGGDATVSIGHGLVVASAPELPSSGGQSNLLAFRLTGCGSRFCPPVWQHHVGSLGVSGTAVSGNTLYATGGAGSAANVYAFRLTDDHALWVASIDPSDTESAPRVVNDVVYVATDRGHIAAVAAAGCGKPACAPLWSRLIGNALGGVPVVADGRLYAAAWSEGLYAYRLPAKGAPVPSPPAVPTGVQASFRGTVATITWSASSSSRFPITNYIVYPHPATVDPQLSSGQSTSSDIQLSPGTSYRFTVVAASAAGYSKPSASSPPAVG